jgi:hypothetical protein
MTNSNLTAYLACIFAVASGQPARHHPCTLHGCCLPCMHHSAMIALCCICIDAGAMLVVRVNVVASHVAVQIAMLL